MGKMWTFENPPAAYFEQAYGFKPDEQWFERARLGALRFATYCSASFVSPNGLVMTNHHCGRESVTKVSRTGEDLPGNGFYADSLGKERKVADLYVEQLVKITDITSEVQSAIKGITDDDQRAEVLQSRTRQITERMTAEAKAQDSTLTVQVVELYSGGGYSAYAFKRYEDVRLVMAPERDLGFFGGDPDNFTYPRYTLDMTFFRVYDKNGAPLQTEHYFPFSENGAQEGESVFLVGNPGSTNRLGAVSELLFQRDYVLPHQLEVLNDRARIIQDYTKTHEEDAQKFDLENTYFTLSNSIKAITGEFEGLNDPYLISRRVAAERDLAEKIAATDSLRMQYGDVLAKLRQLQQTKVANAPQSSAFAFFGTEIGSHVLLRALYGYYYALLKQRGADKSRLEEIREDALKIASWPKEIEKGFIASRLRELQEALGATDPTVLRLLQGRAAAAVAEQVVEGTALTDSSGFAQLLDKGYLSSSDPTVPLIQALGPLYFSVSDQTQRFEAREKGLNAQLARARFALSGTDIPPDATFSLRIADGIVSSYVYNGTLAPSHTTFYGLYNHYYSYGPGTDWNLPERWLNAPKTFDRSTPLNLVSTNDMIGGNSGSPLLNRDLQVVGLAFDGNIESLPGNFIYLTDRARSVSVDSRGILESLDEVYDADRLVLEMKTGKLASTEQEADAMQP